MEYVLLTKIGFVIDLCVKGGYIFAGSYLVRTAIRYVSDYKESVKNDEV